MGRGKLKRKAKAKAKRIKKIKSGRLVRFVLANSPQKYNGWSNKYKYQSNIHNLIYKGASFSNDKFQNCTITRCNFKQTNFEDVDFAHCNLKGSSFKNATLTNVTFFNCNMKAVDFEGAKFSNVVFICMSIDAISNLPEAGHITLKKYPQITHQQLIDSAMSLARYDELYKYHILNVSKTKVNHWYLHLLATQYSNYDEVASGLSKLCESERKRDFITLSSYKKFLDKYLKV